MVAAAVGGAALVGGVMSSQAQSKASRRAADSQTEAAYAQIDESSRQFDVVRDLLKPYAEAGAGSVDAQRALLGLSGSGAQQQAISDLQASPAYQAKLQQGVDLQLQNASATGGLRGGNNQQALGYLGMNTLQDAIQQQFSNLGFLTGVGANAAAGTGNAALATGQQTQQALGTIGAANSANALAQGKASAQMWNTIPQALGAYTGAGGSF